MDNLKTLLENTARNEPPEIGRIKKFVLETYQLPVSVSVTETEILLYVSSASMAGALRMRTPELQKVAQTTKKIRLIIR